MIKRIKGGFLIGIGNNYWRATDETLIAGAILIVIVLAVRLFT